MRVREESSHRAGVVVLEKYLVFGLRGRNGGKWRDVGKHGADGII